jgi:monothiol glutaredoxin
LFVEGELIGGCDILTEMYEKGELQTLISEASQRAGTPAE